MEFRLGKVAGLQLSAELSAVVGLLLLWGALGAVGAGLLDLPRGAAIGGGFLATSAHVVSEFIHQLGHARAARKTGYPMSGVRFWWIFGASCYPPDEGELPAAVHIRRALGGAPLSLLVSLIAANGALALRPTGGVFWWVALFVFLDNLFVFTLGAFLPLGFTDGSTLLYWWRRR